MRYRIKDLTALPGGFVGTDLVCVERDVDGEPILYRGTIEDLLEYISPSPATAPKGLHFNGDSFNLTQDDEVPHAPATLIYNDFAAAYSGGVLTVPATGYYHVEFYGYVLPVIGVSHRPIEIRVYVNGSIVVSNLYPQTEDESALSFSAVIKAGSGHELRVAFFTSDAGAGPSVVYQIDSSYLKIHSL